MMPSNSNLDFYDRFVAPYQALYAMVDEDEAVDRWVNLLEENRLIVGTAARHFSPPSLLDVGCGPGRHLPVWQKQGFAPTGLDASPAMLAAAKQHLLLAGANCPLVLTDILASAGPESDHSEFSFAVSHLFFPNLFPPHQLVSLFQGIARFLAPGGLWIADLRTDLPGSLPTSESIDIDGTTWARTSAFDASSGAYVQMWSTGTTVLEERFWHHNLAHLESAASKAGLRILLEKKFSDTPLSSTAIIQRQAASVVAGQAGRSS